ncbi:MAG TPA: alpha/beta hydrolase, partial [Trebonia sp.]|nr:alpha/beta hydrolase [Trebonia sp.]
MSFPRRGAAGVATLTALAATVALTACSAGTAEPATAPGASVSADGGAGSPAVVPPGTAGSALRWSACGSQLAGMQCASLQVPLNYADPGGRKITIALSMVPATAPKSQQQGVMLVNPGGPGAPGRLLAGATATSLSPQVAADYDIVGFDPRGVGGSVPALSCDPGYFSGRQPDYIPANAAAEQVLIN